LAAYLPKIVRLAENNLGARYAANFGADDVAMSVIRTVFRRIQSGDFEFDDDESLWKQLVTITLRRLSNKIRYENADKRSIKKTVNADEDFLVGISREPNPEEAIALMDLLEKIGKRLDDEGKQVLELRMANYSYSETARKLKISDRSVGRKIKLIKEALAEECAT